MTPKGREVYTEEEESRIEAAGREELTHFRQDPGGDFTDPTQVMVAKAGSKRRTSFKSKAIIKHGPDFLKGAKTALYVVYNEQNETELVEVKTAAELANLPSGAVPALEFLNLAEQEQPGLADELFNFLALASTHTANHTAGADLGARAKAILAKNQLAQLQYQDSQIGEGIKVPDARHRRHNPQSLTNDDGVPW